MKVCREAIDELDSYETFILMYIDRSYLHIVFTSPFGLCEKWDRD